MKLGDIVKEQFDSLEKKFNDYTGYRDRFRVSTALDIASWASIFIPHDNVIMSASENSPNWHWFTTVGRSWHITVQEVLPDITRLFSDWYRPKPNDALAFVDQNSDEFRKLTSLTNRASFWNSVSWGAAAVEWLTVIPILMSLYKGKVDPTRIAQLNNMWKVAHNAKYVTRALADYSRPGPIQPKSLVDRATQQFWGFFTGSKKS